LGEGLGYGGGARDRTAAVSSVPELESAKKKMADTRAPAVSGCWWRDAYRFGRAGKWAVGRIPAWADSVPVAFLPFFKTIFLFPIFDIQKGFVCKQNCINFNSFKFATFLKRLEVLGQIKCRTKREQD
jgi:hypothetical protein